MRTRSTDTSNPPTEETNPPPTQKFTHTRLNNQDSLVLPPNLPRIYKLLHWDNCRHKVFQIPNSKNVELPSTPKSGLTRHSHRTMQSKAAIVLATKNR
eukprot:2135722-Amphidinium_carterae.1